ncbi:glycosyltransferase family 2 protein [Jannaschia sp. KMU-145]|uniref:glycosyltransferase family 2 protein n=1 Tax=Jannaschia halovivens TaxID=3388667 RepID=UPI00396B0713
MIDDMARPTVSVVMATHQGATHLEAAVRSVLAQSHRDLELILVDDASTDATPAIIRRMAEQDARVRPITLATNVGAAAARNATLDAARGDWIAIVDSDDAMHPARIERLIEAAEILAADMIADDMVHFGDPQTAGVTLLGDLGIDGTHAISATALVTSDTAEAGRASMGYLKPVIRAARLKSLRYDKRLRVGEDFDLYLRLLLAGAAFHVVPDPTYLYRRHAGSLSHRLSSAAAAALVAAHGEAWNIARRTRPDDGPLDEAMAARDALLRRKLDYARLVEDLKARRPFAATMRIARRPALLADLRDSLSDRRQRRRTQSPGPTGAATETTVVLAPADCVTEIDAPPDAIRIPVSPMRAPTARTGDSHVLLARQLAELASRGPVRIVAEGVEGRHAAGYLP